MCGCCLWMPSSMIPISTFPIWVSIVQCCINNQHPQLKERPQMLLVRWIKRAKYSHDNYRLHVKMSILLQLMVAIIFRFVNFTLDIWHGKFSFARVSVRLYWIFSFHWNMAKASTFWMEAWLSLDLTMQLHISWATFLSSQFLAFVVDSSVHSSTLSIMKWMWCAESSWIPSGRKSARLYS